ncbi:MAG: ParA family protein [Deltaproteobacteria bacterium]|uniref:ParA family protein n=1 Tax=Candidatus Zymogenus saltonus TaxID=2844893 RepID=A0A9D8KHU2_9DELT|nr:ParA family protein [Candidatus Zymogenus saltonus]
MARVLAVVSQKGGVGKTTTAVNLAASVAALEVRTLLVGIDPQCGVSSSFEHDKKGNKYGLYDLLYHDVSIVEAIFHTEIKFLDVIGSNVKSSSEEDILNQIMKKDKFKLKQMFAEVDKFYDYIILDCPPSLGSISIATMIAADSILIPVQGEYFSKESLGRLLQTAREVARTYNPSLTIEGVLLTMVDFRTNLGKKVAEDIKKAMGEKVFSTIIPRTVRLAEAPMMKKPVILSDINSKGAMAYLALAQEILTKHEEEKRGKKDDVLNR